MSVIFNNNKVEFRSNNLQGQRQVIDVDITGWKINNGFDAGPINTMVRAIQGDFAGGGYAIYDVPMWEQVNLPEGLQLTICGPYLRQDGDAIFEVLLLTEGYEGVEPEEPLAIFTREISRQRLRHPQAQGEPKVYKR